MEKRLELIQLDPNYRAYFHDGTFIGLFSNMPRLAAEVERIEPGSAEMLFRFLGDNANKYRLGMPFVERNYKHLTDLANPIAGWRLFRPRAHQNLYRQVAQYFKTDKLRKAFSFHPMFLGLSPFDAPAMYSFFTYADLALGMWYPKGGIYTFIEDLLELAVEMGVNIRTNAPVQRILTQGKRVSGVTLSSGEMITADLVVSNADLSYTYKHLLSAETGIQNKMRRMERMNISCSGYLLYLGVNKTYPHLNHQALFFSKDYRANLDAIFVTKTLPEDPSFHMHIPTQTDANLAPPGHSIKYLLAPMPNLSPEIDWKEVAPLVRGQIIQRLEEILDPDIRRHIVWERQYTPLDFERDFNAVPRTAFGSLSHNFFQSAYFHPPIRRKTLRVCISLVKVLIRALECPWY